MARASPKSATLTRPSEEMRTFSGLMSRWTMPARWAASSADSTGAMTSRDCRGESRPRSRIRSRRVAPSTYSMTRKTTPLSLPWSKTATTLGWLSRAADLASRVNLETNSGSSASVECMTLTATRRSSRVSSAR